MAVIYRLEDEDGMLLDPTYRTAVPAGNPGDTIPIGDGRTLHVTDTRLDEGTDGDPSQCSWSTPG